MILISLICSFESVQDNSNDFIKLYNSPIPLYCTDAYKYANNLIIIII